MFGGDIDDKNFKFICLGGGNEVGRLCHVIEYHGKVIMLDAGVHPAYSGMNALPFYDEYDLSKVDMLLISHFHLDHAASLPYVMQHTNFKGRVFMTHPTKAIFRWLLNDFIKVTSIGEASTLYTEEDLQNTFDKIETIDYHSTMEVDGVKFTAYHAGHVLGAAMFFIEISSLKILFTGDYSREKDRHLNIAEVPPQRPDILICESTFGTATHEKREEKEIRLTNIIHKTVLNGGNVLLPVFALGRAQELLLLLDEYWGNNEDLEPVQIYYASSMAKKCMTVYKTYINMMNESIRKKFRSENSNPFKFKYISYIKSLDRIDYFRPCVVVASPGMLQNGLSRELLERWAPDSRNSLILTGYSVEGTMAKSILTEPLEIPSVNNPDLTIPRRLNVNEISFAAHVDYEQNSTFIDLVKPKHIILVHGEHYPMGRLKSALLLKYSKFKNTKNEVNVFTPRNGYTLNIEIQAIKNIKALGSLVTKILSNDPINLNDKKTTLVNGVLVSNSFEFNLMKVDDLRELTNLTTTMLQESQVLRMTCGKDLIFWHLQQMFGYVEVVHDTEDEFELKVMNDVVVTLEQKDICTVLWTSGLINDTVADSIIGILLSIDSSPASVKMTSKGSCGHAHNHDEHSKIQEVKEEDDHPDFKKEDETISSISDSILLQHADTSIKTRIHRIISLLKIQFGDSFQGNEKSGTVTIGSTVATIDFYELQINCSSNILKNRLEQIVNRACELAAPLAQDVN